MGGRPGIFLFLFLKQDPQTGEPWTDQTLKHTAPGNNKPVSETQSVGLGSPVSDVEGNKPVATAGAELAQLQPRWLRQRPLTHVQPACHMDTALSQSLFSVLFWENASSCVGLSVSLHVCPLMFSFSSFQFSFANPPHLLLLQLTPH